MTVKTEMSDLIIVTKRQYRLCLLFTLILIASCIKRIHLLPDRVDIPVVGHVFLYFLFKHNLQFPFSSIPTLAGWIGYPQNIVETGICSSFTSLPVCDKVLRRSSQAGRYHQYLSVQKIGTIPVAFTVKYDLQHRKRRRP